MFHCGNKFIKSDLPKPSSVLIFVGYIKKKKVNKTFAKILIYSDSGQSYTELKNLYNIKSKRKFN